jgi:hypothetical protein
MADLKLDLLIVPTYNLETLAIVDNSVYTGGPISSYILTVSVPGFNDVVVPFVPNTINIYNSESFELTSPSDPLLPLPDGIYCLTYTTVPPYLPEAKKTFLRVDQLQQKFDSAFMKLDMMECDLAIKKQQKVDLNSVYYFIQGAIAAANNCATDVALKLYAQADKMLNNFIRSNCGCSGNNY